MLTDVSVLESPNCSWKVQRNGPPRKTIPVNSLEVNKPRGPNPTKYACLLPVLSWDGLGSTCLLSTFEHSGAERKFTSKESLYPTH